MINVCDHCGVNIFIQPPKESGCNHVHYPEACDVCTKKRQDNCEHTYSCSRCGLRDD
jgi:hypothetical protein